MLQGAGDRAMTLDTSQSQLRHCLDGVCTEDDPGCYRDCFPHTRRDGACARVDAALLADPSRIGHVYRTRQDCELRTSRASLDSLRDTLFRVVEQFSENILEGSSVRITSSESQMTHGEEYVVEAGFEEYEDWDSHPMHGMGISLKRGRAKYSEAEYEIGDVVQYGDWGMFYDQEGWKFPLKCRPDMLAGGMLYGDNIQLRADSGHEYTAEYVHTSEEGDGRRRYVAYLRSLLQLVEGAVAGHLGNLGLIDLVQRRIAALQRAQKQLGARRPMWTLALYTQAVGQVRRGRRETEVAREALVSNRPTDPETLQEFVLQLLQLDDRLRQIDGILVALTERRDRMDRSLERAALCSVIIRSSLGERAHAAERMARVVDAHTGEVRAIRQQHTQELERIAAQQGEQEIRRAQEAGASRRALLRHRWTSVGMYARQRALLKRTCSAFQTALRAQEDASRRQAENMQESMQATVRAIEAHGRSQIDDHKRVIGDIISRAIVAFDSRVRKYAKAYTCMACGEDVVDLNRIAFPSCCWAHGVCSDCFPEHVKYMINKVIPSSVDDVYVPCYNSLNHKELGSPDCLGRYSYHNAVTCCNAVLQQELPASSSESGSPSSVAYELHLWSVAAYTRFGREQRAERADRFRAAMERNGWRPRNPSENRVHQCPVCNFGPIEHNNCFDLDAHHGEVSGPHRTRICNACPICGHRAADHTGWRVWDGNPSDELLFSDEELARRSARRSEIDSLIGEAP